MIFSDSPEAAQYREDIKGWVSANGIYCGEKEQQARSLGATHRRCNGCETPLEKRNGRTVCKACWAKREVERYHAYPRKPWDGESPLYSESCDAWFWGWDEVEDYCAPIPGERGPLTLEDLRLVLCVPEPLRQIEEDFFDLPEGSELPDDIWEKVEALNKALRECRPLSWLPTRFALDLSAEIPAPPDFTGWSEEERALWKRIQEGEAVAISVRKKGPHARLLAWAKEHDRFVYVGRAMPRQGLKKHPLANPFTVKEHGREGALEKYQGWLLSQDEGLEPTLASFRGKALGCWCKPQNCHADVLVALANTLPEVFHSKEPQR